VYEGPWDGNLAYNDAPFIWCPLLKPVNPTGGGAAKTYTITVGKTADTFVYLTDQWGDDVTTDWIHGGSMVINSLTTGFDEELGAWTVSTENIYARAAIGGPTGGLSVDTTPNWVYGSDTELFVDTTTGAIGTTKWTDALHTVNLEIGANNDRKRFANGSNTRRELSGYGRGAREMTLTLGVAKTTETIAERAAINSVSAPNPVRYIELRTTSPEIITGSTPFSQSIRIPVFGIKANDVEFGDNNTGYEFTYRGFYDSTLTYAIRVVVVCETTTNFA
jgi:hypothetical protein